MAQRKESVRGMQQIIIDLLVADDPNALWTIAEIAETLEFEEKQIANAVYNAWILGKICRHTIKDSGKVRYAMKIADKDKVIYEDRKPINPNANGKPKKRKGSHSTGKEIRMMFADAQRSLMRLEDAVMSKVEDAEETEKNITKLRNLL